MEKKIRVQENKTLWTTSNSPNKIDIKQPDESKGLKSIG